ncbi:bifunctional molybdenum cofactor biosynthesis protein MoaC/MoaB [Anaplasmataceae bacterium AB001_6]|nr:bifunctional molybdenum cofactor biosynthesis protein MoaC/MoaB [Anaplasmataceae bacterium AB001_6]
MHKNIIEFFNENSNFHMKDISYKKPNIRRAIAMGCINIGEIGFKHVKNGTLAKGDVLKLAEIAGLQGAKNTWQQIPMCHPIPLEHIAVYPELKESSHSVIVYTIVSTIAKTGVEMEALSAVNAALLTLYDLIKPVEAGLSISDIRLLLKEGGKSNLWIHPRGIPEKIKEFIKIPSERLLEGKKVGIITLSDRAHNKEYQDKSGIILKEKLEHLGCNIVDYSILPDESVQLEEKINKLTKDVEIIITTGGTGIAPRDITPQTISKIADQEIPGIGELLRSYSALHVPKTWLSRSGAVVMDNTLIIALPGSPSAVQDGIEALKEILPHALDSIQNKKNIHKETLHEEIS